MIRLRVHLIRHRRAIAVATAVVWAGMIALILSGHGDLARYGSIVGLLGLVACTLRTPRGPMRRTRVGSRSRSGRRTAWDSAISEAAAGATVAAARRAWRPS